jgi:hypothetical protein
MESLIKDGTSGHILGQGGSGGRRDDDEDKQGRPPPSLPPAHAQGGEPELAAQIFQGLFDAENGSMEDPASAELARLALVERLKNEGVTPGQQANVLSDLWPTVKDIPDLVLGGGDQALWDAQMKPEIDNKRRALSTKVSGAILEDKTLPKGLASDVMNGSSMLDASLLADLQDQGATDEQMGEILRGGQVMVPGRRLAEEWNGMPQADTRRSSHHTPNGKSGYESGRGFSGTPDYQLDSRRHSGMSAPLVHHALTGTVTEKDASTFGDSTFVQLENTPWSEGADPEVYGDAKDAKVPKAPTKEKLGHTLDATKYVLGGMKKNVGPYGKSPYTDTTAPFLKKDPRDPDGKKDDDDNSGGLTA